MIPTFGKAAAFSLAALAPLFAQSEIGGAGDQSLRRFGEPTLIAAADTADRTSIAAEETDNQPTINAAGQNQGAGAAIQSESASEANAQDTNRTKILGQAEALDEIVVIDQTGGGGGFAASTRSITDALRSNSKIQYLQSDRSSARGGEIAPPKVSIRGSQHYENSFLINGVGNNNNINPGGFENNDPTGFASGEAQSLFIDTSLVQSVNAYTENISAEYGGFTGGVVDAKLKDARTDRWHVMANLRYTQDGWAKFHLNDAQENTVYATSASYQPEFNKYDGALSLDGPINDYLGLMLSYGRQYSKIPLYSGYNLRDSGGSFSKKERRTQYRENENYLVKLNGFSDGGFEADLTAIYAPYTQSLFRSNVKNSDYDVTNGGLDVILNTQNELNFGVLKNTLSYKRTSSGIDDAEFYAYTWRVSPIGGAVDWNSSGANAQEGSRGNQDFLKSDIGLKSALYLDDIYAGDTKHAIKVGAEAEYTTAKFEFDGGTTYSSPQLNVSATGSKEDGIIDGEQYAANKIEYGALERSKDYYTAALFLEDEIGIERFTFRPGVRVSTDNLTDNKDVAHRLFANVDIFNDKFLNLYGGVNRYYGTQILGYAVYKYQADSYTRSAYNAPWVLGAAYPSVYEYKHLKTPYSDEYSAGSSVNFADTLFKLEYVNRQHRDQIKARYTYAALAPNTFDYYNTNEGKTDYWGVTFSASKNYDIGSSKHVSEFSATRSDTRSNLTGLRGFQDAMSINRSNSVSPTHVTYDGEVKLASELPASQFNSPWIVTYTHMAQIANSVRVSGVAWYQKGGRGLRQLSGTGDVDPAGLPTRIFEVKKYKDVFNVDLSVHYDIKVGDNVFTLGLEILNLLDRENDASATNSTGVFSATSVEEYSMGRQFYASLRYEY
ncbi:MAG: TonB-dependent receptor plug domain-containing protein [Helicobacteraceae bacterium]|nr:TonB-dependent receptor plug domain-containing protein [Helicobacteraceae bacterium]